MNTKNSGINTGDLMKDLTALCKQRGFVFQSSEIYGGLKSAYDYGPLGIELKRNIMNEWWRSMIYEREDDVGLDASIMMHPKVWQASGHLSGFSDPLVDCLLTKERFRADKAPRPNPGDELPLNCSDKGQAKTYQKMVADQFGIELKRDGKVLTGLKVLDEKTVGFFPDEDAEPVKFPFRGYVSPIIGSPFLSEERKFNLMFRTSMGPIDPIGEIVNALEGKDLSRDEMMKIVEDKVRDSAVYLRPETAQAMFVQFRNIQSSMSMKVPFGIAQMGKSFRNEITVEHFIFRSCEFEQMEMQWFCKSEDAQEMFDFWRQKRLDFYHDLGLDKEKLRLRPHEKDELSHYSSQTDDVEYNFPFGWKELEGIAHRGNYDLTQHTKHAGKELAVFDEQTKSSYIPDVIECSVGSDRLLLTILFDSYREDSVDGETRNYFAFKPSIAPIKAAFFPLSKKLEEPARAIFDTIRKSIPHIQFDVSGSIGKRYRRQDEIGTPLCFTYDFDSAESNTITVRDRNTTKQERIAIDEILPYIQKVLAS